MIDFGTVESEKSFNPVKPGAEVEVTLKQVEITEEGHLDLHFDGAHPDNLGSFKPRFWAGNFDTDNPKYNPDLASNNMRQLKHILQGYFTDEKVATLKGNNTAEIYAKIQQMLTPDVIAEVVAKMKIVYKWDSDTLCVIPKYGSFFSTTFRPRRLFLKDTVDKDKVPFDRVLPRSTYGVTADAGAPPANAYGEQEAPSFGGATGSEPDIPF